MVWVEFSVWLVSCYAHVFVVLSVVIVTMPIIISVIWFLSVRLLGGWLGRLYSCDIFALKGFPYKECRLKSNLLQWFIVCISYKENC